MNKILRNCCMYALSFVRNLTAKLLNGNISKNKNNLMFSLFLISRLLALKLYREALHGYGYSTCCVKEYLSSIFPP